MAYIKKIWEDYPNTTTPILASDMNNIENGIEAVDTVVNSGWVPLTGTFTYSSADSPTFVMTTSVDLTQIVGLGMRIKLTQTTTKYFIVTAITNNSITMYGGTDYTLVNDSISNVYYSIQKAPFGFPLEVSKWTVYMNTVSVAYQATPTVNTWYNIDNRKLDVPIGSWLLSYSIPIDCLMNEGVFTFAFYSTLSTANNTANTALLCGTQQTAGDNYLETSHDSNVLPITVTSKTSYYLNVRSLFNTTARLRYATWKVFRIQAVCAYL